MKKIDSIDEYIESNSHFKAALKVLRQIINSTQLEETIKWHSPVYELNGKKLVGIGAFKNHFSLWFFNGVFLKDESKLLEKAQETTKALRQMRFESLEDIDENVVLSYIKEAIENQKLGKELNPERKGKTVVIPKELQKELKADSAFLGAFKIITPGRHCEYCKYIATAKREETNYLGWKR